MNTYTHIYIYGVPFVDIHTYIHTYTHAQVREHEGNTMSFACVHFIVRNHSNRNVTLHFFFTRVGMDPLHMETRARVHYGRIVR